jgi:phosphatidylglycerophosphatase A
MNYLRRLQYERPVLFWVVLAVGFWLGFQLLLFIASLVIGPFGLPAWAPLVVVLGVLVVIEGVRRIINPPDVEGTAVLVVALVGTWAATRAEKLLGKKDPGAVVVDEVAGQLIAFLFVPWRAGTWAVVAGFVAFRLFDIWKPYPVRRLEDLGGGLGIMADDCLAGFYAAALMSLLVSIRTLTF